MSALGPRFDELIDEVSVLRAPDVAHAAVLRHVQRFVPFETAILLPKHGDQPPGTLQKEPSHRRIYAIYRSNEARYSADLRKGRQVAARDGAFLDNEVYTAAERGKLGFFREIVAPQGITSRLVIDLSFRGAVIATMHLCRHGRSSPMLRRHFEQLLPSLPAIALVTAAFGSSARPEEPPIDLDGLAPRERQIVSYVRRGYQNKEIATLLSLSPLTVRNRLSLIFKKTGVTSRTALVGRLR